MKKLMKGNEAIAEAAVQAGCKFFFGYPITPQNEIPEYMSRRMPETGGCFLQAESEVAAINMVYGAGGAGARVMTSSSSPGISLKQEGISYLAGAEVPCVIVNIMRGGPGLGGIQPAQSDYYQATRGGGHGDYRTCVLAPASVQEAVDLTQAAFDIADRYRNPVMVLGDGMIGQMMEPVDMDKPYRPAVDLAEKLWAATGHVPTPGHPRSIVNSLYIDPKVLERHCERLDSKYKKIAKNECRWQEEMLADAEIVVVAYGTTSRIARSAIRKCREQGIKVGMLRPITLWPFPTQALRKTLRTAKSYLVVEMSAGQMVDDVRLAVSGERPVHFYGRMGGMVPSVSEVMEEIKKNVSPPVLNPADIALNKAIDDKFQIATSAISKILKQAGRRITSTAKHNSTVQPKPSTMPEAKEADTMFDEHSFDEIEEKFKSTLDKMKQKLKDASGRMDAASSAEMAKKVRNAAETMAQRIQEAALKMEHKLEDAGISHDDPSLNEIEEDLNIAAEEMDHAFESVAEAVETQAEEAAEAAAGKGEEAAADTGRTPDGKVESFGRKIEFTFEAAGKKLDDISMEDIEEKFQSAAKVVEEKLNEAGKKIDELLNDPKTKQKAEEAGRQINDFFDRTGKSIASGIDSFMKVVGRAAENIKKDWDEAQSESDQKKDKEDE